MNNIGSKIKLMRIATMTGNVDNVKNIASDSFVTHLNYHMGSELNSVVPSCSPQTKYKFNRIKKWHWH